jgi:hypothetical protein
MLKGSFQFFEKLIAPEACAVIDVCHVAKGGDAYAHVSIYPTPPVTTTVTLDRMISENVKEEYQEEQTDRGPVIEHFTFTFTYKGGNIFEEAYEALKTNERVSAMLPA